MKLLTTIIHPSRWKSLLAASSVLSMVFASVSAVAATSPLVAAEIEKGESPGMFAVEGAIDKVWIEYGVKVKGVTGIRIHTKFSVKKAANIECVILAIIVRADGRPLDDGGSAYSTSDGRVAVHKAFTPRFDPADYPDTKFFIPYWALSLKENNPNKMKVSVTLLNQGKEFARSTLDFGFAIGKAPFK